VRFTGWDIAFWVIITAAIMSLVRPRSKGAQLVVDVTSAVAAVVGTATGYTQRGGN
jgi:hypothetical protein